MVDKNDTVTWEYGSGSFTGTSSGKVLETDLNKFGYTNVIKVRTSKGEITHVRPKDLQS